MKKVLMLAVLVLATAGLAMAQMWSSPVDVLGAHNNNGRGCAGCHSPHSGSFGSGHGGAADAGSYALWGQDASPLYGKTIAFGETENILKYCPSTIAGGSQEVGGILLCLSCHDGNVTQSNMMANQSYEQRIGLLTNTAMAQAPSRLCSVTTARRPATTRTTIQWGSSPRFQTGNGLVTQRQPEIP